MENIEYLNLFNYEPIYEFRLYASKPSKWLNLNSIENCNYVKSLDKSEKYLSITFKEVLCSNPKQYKITNVCNDLFPDRALCIKKYKEAIADNSPGGREEAKHIAANLLDIGNNKMMVLDMFKPHLENAKKSSSYMKARTRGLSYPLKIDYATVNEICNLLLKAIDDYTSNYKSLLNHLGF